MGEGRGLRGFEKESRNSVILQGISRTGASVVQREVSSFRALREGQRTPDRLGNTSVCDCLFFPLAVVFEFGA